MSKRTIRRHIQKEIDNLFFIDEKEMATCTQKEMYATTNINDVHGNIVEDNVEEHVESDDDLHLFNDGNINSILNVLEMDRNYENDQGSAHEKDENGVNSNDEGIPNENEHNLNKPLRTLADDLLMFFVMYNIPKRAESFTHDFILSQSCRCSKNITFLN